MHGEDSWAGKTKKFYTESTPYPFFATIWNGWMDCKTHKVLTLQQPMENPDAWWEIVQGPCGTAVSGAVFSVVLQPTIPKPFKTNAAKARLDKLTTKSENVGGGAPSDENSRSLGRELRDIVRGPGGAGWNPVKETEELASGGQRAHGLVLDSDLDSEGILDRIHNLVRYKPGRVCDNRPFVKWLRSCEWERSGSSSIRRVEYEVEVDGERRRGHFKARKNLILDVFPFDDLVERVRQHDSQENKALVKSEFGKVRLAVSAPLDVYLQQGFLYGVSGSAYLSWPGNTPEESVGEEMRRTERTFVQMASGAYALPYDFARFDHQPTTDEVVA
ncbi:hypothetical protein MTO96_026369 [Rhipicephalus appendiculatus]